jgi:hypothetical protein
VPQTLQAFGDDVLTVSLQSRVLLFVWWEVGQPASLTTVRVCCCCIYALYLYSRLCSQDSPRS